MVVSALSLEILFEDRKAKQYITDFKFTPDGEMVAIASFDGKVYIHRSSNYALVRTLSMPSKGCAVTRIDFSLDLNWATLKIRVATSLDELFHFTASNGEVITAPLAVRDVVWASATCTYKWMSQGIWRPMTDGINVLAINLHPSGKIAAVSYQDGGVRLYKFPCQTSQVRLSSSHSISKLYQ